MNSRERRKARRRHELVTNAEAPPPDLSGLPPEVAAETDLPPDDSPPNAGPKWDGGEEEAEAILKMLKMAVDPDALEEELAEEQAGVEIDVGVATGELYTGPAPPAA